LGSSIFCTLDFLRPRLHGASLDFLTLMETNKMNGRPRVSIGLPVFNGERYLAAAIESILAQSFVDLELIICDNASTDATKAICMRYANEDQRVRYFRHDQNLGAAANFNFTVKLATGEYFKWAAHDDLLEREFLEKCIEALEADPGAVLCCSLATMLGANGAKWRERYDAARLNVEHPRPSQRFGARLRTLRFVEVFGVIRTKTLKQTDLIGKYPYADRVLLAELALFGRFINIPEFLFTLRDHPERSARLKNPEDLLAWYDPDRTERRVFATWTRYSAYLRMIRRHVSDPAEKARCWGMVLWSLCVNGHLLRLALDPLIALDPRIFPAIMSVRHKLFGGTKRTLYKKITEESDLDSSFGRGVRSKE
jgi:glycosyltransferase involved in cell wall biosynthesis